MTIYTLRCGQTGESQDVLVCDKHTDKMPPVDGEHITATPCDSSKCEFCNELSSKIFS